MALSVILGSFGHTRLDRVSGSPIVIGDVGGIVVADDSAIVVGGWRVVVVVDNRGVLVGDDSGVGLGKLIFVVWCGGGRKIPRKFREFVKKRLLLQTIQ